MINDRFYCHTIKVDAIIVNKMCQERSMYEEMENVEEVSVEEALQMEIIFGQALMDVLIAKGFISEQEVLDRVEEIRGETGFELS